MSSRVRLTFAASVSSDVSRFADIYEGICVGGGMLHGRTRQVQEADGDILDRLDTISKIKRKPCDKEPVFLERTQDVMHTLRPGKHDVTLSTVRSIETTFGWISEFELVEKYLSTPQWVPGRTRSINKTLAWLTSLRGTTSSETIVEQQLAAMEQEIDHALGVN